ncbi:HIPL1 protein-like isoform X2 [Miscanthus floridulus]|uniref:HIPL1 protein-like isoform X2 n=1 Tax=Miscanthus floridulus TaxID=154761 RepID=UPI003457EE2A
MAREQEVIRLLLLLSSAWSTSSTSPGPVCAGSREPVVLGQALEFCGGDAGLSCCDADDDAGLRAELDGMPISNAACFAILKDVLCARCVPSLSANSVDSATTMKHAVPLLCESAQSSTSAQHQPGPPATRLPWEQGCLERISAGSFVTMAAHPDGSGRVFLSSQDGKIWLVSMPHQGSGVTLHSDSPFLDISDRVHHDAVLGLVGVAFHPEFTTNGRLFVSYYCDSSTSPVCGAGTCWGSAAGNGSQLCRYQLVVSEFSAKGGTDYSKATRAYSSEVRRIFTMGLPYPHTSYSYQHHGGQILFWPSDSDGYLYLVTGNGDFSKNGRSFFGKILRFYVGGSFVYRATPKIEKPEIFAAGLNNPNGCSFDSNRPSYLYCADVNEKQYELVHLIRRGRNYSGSSMKVTVSSIINQGRPADGRMPSIVGGLMYRGSADPLLKGRYLYVYASGVWAGVDALESRSNGSSASAQVPIVRCSRSSPVPCNGIGIGITGRVLSLGEDSSKDAFVLGTRGVFRLVPPSLCGVTQPLLQPARGAGWLLFVSGFALLLGFYMVWTTIFGGGGQIKKSCNECFREISCCTFYFWGTRKRSARITKKKRLRWTKLAACRDLPGI